VNDSDVVIIGAGPSGSVAAALLARAGRSVTVLERQKFPRFSIGESLLPQSMEFLERAQMLRAVVEAGYQYKNGAAFVRGERRSSYDFRDKYSPGWGTTYQVVRADFDNLLAQESVRLGARVLFQHEILEFEHNGAASLVVKAADGSVTKFRAKFVLDGSGFGRCGDRYSPTSPTASRRSTTTARRSWSRCIRIIRTSGIGSSRSLTGAARWASLRKTNSSRLAAASSSFA
jgi:flavin-dependent dehydrogenase